MSVIAVLGTGYVGLVTGACLADFGLQVTCYDIDCRKIDDLNNGHLPIYEPGLDTVVKRNLESGRLRFAKDIQTIIREADVIFIAVGTPALENGSADLSSIMEASKVIALHMNNMKIIVSKSTVPIGTTRRIKTWISDELSLLGKSINFHVVSNPEFLREGSAVYDFMHPDRVIIGCESEISISTIKDVYRVLYLNEIPFVITTLETAEMIKYASNTFLALKISFINQMANLCEYTGANVLDVAKAMGKDGRIGPKFLHPGPGFGGSCFPKDIKALTFLGKQVGYPLTIVDEIIKSNEDQKNRMVAKITSAFDSVRGRTIGILGLSFKPNTDDVRESPSLFIISELLRLGASINAFDPAVSREICGRHFKNVSSIRFALDEYGTMEKADALVIVTEWNQFRNLDLDKIKKAMNGNLFFDLRNIYHRNDVEAKGFVYIGVGT